MNLAVCAREDLHVNLKILPLQIVCAFQRQEKRAFPLWYCEHRFGPTWRTQMVEMRGQFQALSCQQGVRVAPRKPDHLRLEGQATRHKQDHQAIHIVFFLLDHPL